MKKFGTCDTSVIVLMETLNLFKRKRVTPEFYNNYKFTITLPLLRTCVRLDWTSKFRSGLLDKLS